MGALTHLLVLREGLLGLRELVALRLIGHGVVVLGSHGVWSVGEAGAGSAMRASIEQRRSCSKGAVSYQLLGVWGQFNNCFLEWIASELAKQAVGNQENAEEGMRRQPFRSGGELEPNGGNVTAAVRGLEGLSDSLSACLSGG